jgi:hypothetical protein
VVVELDVGDHRHLDVEREHGAVGLVGLHDEPVPRPPVRVLPEVESVPPMR